MALDAQRLENSVKKKITSKGFKIIGLNEIFIKAVCQAVVEEIKANAQVNVTSGNSAGNYKVN